MKFDELTWYARCVVRYLQKDRQRAAEIIKKAFPMMHVHGNPKRKVRDSAS